MTREKTLEALRRLARFLEPIAESDSDAEEVIEDLNTDAEEFLEAVESAVALIEGPEDEDEDEFDDDDEFESDEDEDEDE